MANRIALNAPAPDFELTDFSGRSVRLSDYRDQRHVVLVLNRGFVWPFCRRHMAQLRDEYDRFTAHGSEIIVVGPEEPAAFRAYWQKHGLPFRGLPDPEHQVLKRYGQQASLFKLGRMPAQIIVDRRGRVRFVHYGHSMMDIPPNSEILTLLEELNTKQIT